MRIQPKHSSSLASSRVWFGLLAGSIAVAAGGSLSAQKTASDAPRYLTPPKTIVDILDAPRTPDAMVSPTHDVIALLPVRNMPSIAELAQPMLRLAGARINPRTNGPHRTQGIAGVTFKSIAGGADRPVTVPAGSTLLPIGFSPDGKHFAFARIAAAQAGAATGSAQGSTGGTSAAAMGAAAVPSPIELWIADVATARAARVGAAGANGLALNAAGSRSQGPCQWLDDGSGLACLTIPAARGAAPPPPAEPDGPNIQETSGKPAPVRTYQDLLTSAYDEALFAYYFTSQIALVDPVSGKTTTVGAAGLIESFNTSPNGAWVLVTRTKRPFSRLVPRDDFPKDVEIWSRAGEKVKTVADMPMGDAVPITGVMTGPRAARWQATEPATLVWAEALDGGDLKNKVPHRDRVRALAAPFTGEPAQLLETEHRFTGIQWTEKGQPLVTEFDRDRRWVRTWLLSPGAAPRRIWDYSREDAYANPGTPATHPVSGALLLQGDNLLMTGTGASPDGDRPFLDRFNLTTLQAERLFRCDASSYETVVAVLTPDAKTILTRRESKTDPPNYVVRALPAGAPRALTAFKDPAPQLAGVQKQLIRYKRKDGLDLSATLYTPPNYTKGTPLPTLLWAYPQEFTSASAAGQVRGSANRFTSIAGPSHLLLLTQGYAIIDNPAIPIVGAGETANDTYVEQLVAGAQAAVDAAVALGVTDRDRVGVGGHSYGAFMTVNLLAHSDIFRMGIARSGAYNRTLTPFGFQAETRSFWEVPQIYAKMSPFWYADKINEPLLMTHGEADDNSGTFPIQSERLYMALKGFGATVRYVTLPHEAHGYAGRESVLHTVAEMVNWADKYLKQAAPRSAPTAAAAASR